MGKAADTLLQLADAPDRFDIPAADLHERQLAAANERFQERRGAIKLLGHRAEEAEIEDIRSFDDIVPLLFAHTTYKSYTESWLTDRNWDRMGRWLQTVSAQPIKGVNVEGIEGIDGWIEQLEAAGHFVSCTSGTTGKSAMLPAAAADMAWVKRDAVNAFAWGSGVTPQQDRQMFGLVPVAAVPRNAAVVKGLSEAYADPDKDAFNYPVPPITIGSLTSMVTLRKSIADGTAKPGDIAAFERTSAQRAESVGKAVGASAEALVAAREGKLFLRGMWASLHQVALAVRALGYSGKDFNPENTMYIGGGLKGATLPADYREFIFETFNIAPDRVFQMYGMQEIASAMPRCQAGRYHIPPWLICMVLDASGEHLLPITADEVEGRAAFFDIALEGRWGGVISGDKIKLTHGACACGHHGPSIADTISRYSDLPGGDKISCSGTIDAYVKGAV